MTTMQYVGQELDIFAHATNWKRYWSSKISDWISGDVLEVGAGLGTNIPVLNPARARSWTALEPDPELAKRLREIVAEDNAAAGRCKVIIGTTQNLEPLAQFDTVLYVDVLEHIERDRDEIERASRLLRTNGNVIVLSPAHQWLYTPFDQAIGHFRRYDRATLAACTPSACKLEKLVYLDSAGLLASLGNRLLLRQSVPSLRQILFWDRYLVPVSTVLDPLLMHALGKSLLGIWRKL
jgi:SAM-dependent methyltransferase